MTNYITKMGPNGKPIKVPVKNMDIEKPVFKSDKKLSKKELKEELKGLIYEYSDKFCYNFVYDTLKLELTIKIDNGFIKTKGYLENQFRKKILDFEGNNEEIFTPPSSDELNKYRKEVEEIFNNLNFEKYNLSKKEDGVEILLKFDKKLVNGHITSINQIYPLFNEFIEEFINIRRINDLKDTLLTQYNNFEWEESKYSCQKDEIYDILKELIEKDEIRTEIELLKSFNDITYKGVITYKHESRY